MFPDNTYISLGISPDADGIVMQPVPAGDHRRPSFAFIIALADLDSRGRAAAVDAMGTIVLTGMKAYFPLINTFAEELIPKKATPLTIHLPDHSGNKRALHMRVYAVNEERIVVFRRFDHDTATGHDPAPARLRQLMPLGPEAVADFVGGTLLAQLSVLHPAVFRPFPALMPVRAA
jgi:hypothetical protein